MTQVIRTIQEWKEIRKKPAFRTKTLGFVPTMGALHAGHAELMRRSTCENELTLASIFVNPTQFNDPKDLNGYPRTFERDLEILSDNKVDFLLYPLYEELYPDSYRFQVSETFLSRDLCGAHRPGHFTGMLTVVLKLLQIAKADRAYFGEKDYQQYLLVRGMAEAFFLDTEIVPVATVREADGLALSSRNTLLSSAERQRAPTFSKLLSSPEAPKEVKRHLENAGFSVDYVEDRCGRRFGAVRLGSVRLIDNVSL